jgi:hypothetical protein
LLVLIAAFGALGWPAAGDDASSVVRYIAHGGGFSIAGDDTFHQRFGAAAESRSGDITVVDFPLLNSMGLPLKWGRTVEWVKIDKPVDPLQMDVQASALVEGYLEGRFGAGAFAVADRGKFRGADGQLVYAFSAKGNLNEVPAAWQGAVLFFDTGVALVSETDAQSSQGVFDSRNGVANADLVGWAQTVRPGG